MTSSRARSRWPRYGRSAPWPGCVTGLGVSSCVLLASACADGADGRADADGWTGTIDTTAAGRVLVSNPDAPIEPAGWTLVERFRVGSLEGDGPETFGDIGDIELGPDGTLYVLDGQAEEIRAFGLDGAHLRTFGRSGQGPGELNRPAGMAFDVEGRLWVMSWGNARYTAFDPGTGAVAGERRRSASYGMFPWPGGFLGDGRMVDVGIALGDDPRGRVALLRLDTAFVPTDTLPMPTADERHRIAFLRGDVMVMSMMQPFAPQPAWDLRPAGGIVVGEGAAYRLHRIGFEGDTTMTIVLDRAPAAITEAEADEALARFRERIEAAAADGVTPDREARIPPTRPAHGALFVDERDRTWVRRSPLPGEDAQWDVFGPNGRYLAVARSPVQPSWVKPSARGGFLAIATMTDGVPAAVVFEVVEDAAPRRGSGG